MLPSLGYFKDIRCPYTNDGHCDRPYCHFKHTKKDQIAENDYSPIASYAAESVLKLFQKCEDMNSTQRFTLSTEILQMFHEFEKKHQEKMTIHTQNQQPSDITYNPTPISKLSEHSKTRHIPIPYTPHRPHISSIPLNVSKSKLEYSPGPTINTTPHIYVPSSLDNFGQVLNKSEDQNKLKVDSNGDLDYYPTASTSNERDFDYVPTDKVSNFSKNLHSSRICYGNIDLTDEFKIIDEILRDENKYEGSKKDSEKISPTVNKQTETNKICFSDSDDRTDVDVESRTYSDSENQKSKKRFRIDNDERSKQKKIKVEYDHCKSKSYDEKEKKGLKDNNNDVSKHKEKNCDCEGKKPEEKLNSENKSVIRNDKDKCSSKANLDNEFNNQRKQPKEHRHSKNLLSKKDLKKENIDSAKKHNSKNNIEKNSGNKSHSTGDHSISVDKKSSHQNDLDKKHKSDNVSTKKYGHKSDSSKKHHSKLNIPLKHTHKKESNIHRSQSNENCDFKRHSSKEKSHSKHTHRSINDKKHKSESQKKNYSKSDTDQSKPKIKIESERTKINVNKNELQERQTSKSLEILNYKSKYKKSKHQKHSSSSSKDKTIHDRSIHPNHSIKESKIGLNIKEVEYQEQSPILDYNDSSDMDEVERECFEIFNSNEQNYNKQTSPKIVPHTKDEVETFTAASKKRISHVNKEDPSILTSRCNSITKPPKLHSMMASRFLIAKEQYEASTSVDPKSSNIDSIPKLQSQVHTPPSSGKKRIAHVPNVSLLLNAKNKVNTLKSKALASPSTTSPVKKITDRYANKENPANRPVVIDPLSQKIPMITRMTVLNNMIDACLFNNLNVMESYEKARNEEFAVFEKCQSTLIYKKSAALAVHRLKVAKHEMLIGTQNLSLPTISLSINRNTTLKGPALYDYLMKWVLSEQQLRDNNFPRLHPTIKGNGAAIIYNHPTQEKLHEEDERICPRCHRHYFVDADGFPRSEEECTYHPQRKYTYRGESKYGCCGGDSASIGCASAPLHVVDYIDYDNLRGFVHTMPPDNENQSFFGIYALDCEMTYTTAGMELSRVTVVDVDCNVVYEKLVLPDHPIVDYNTRFSGLTEEIMKNAKTTLLEVQATLLHLFNSKTILIGHSLESDFKTLKFIHDVVIDTSILFPHRLGPPMKRGLKNLASDYLRKIIQNSISGHDSAEDAVTCMELVIFKLKEHLKTA